MAFDTENSVQQGFNRDIETNDWHVEVQNIEVRLGDAGGGTEFRILDIDNVGVVVADSDGYLSIAGNAEVHGGNVLVRGESQTNTSFIDLEDQVDGLGIYLFDVNPDGFIIGEQGSFGANYNDGYFYVNADGATKWERLAYVSQVPALAGGAVDLQTAYENGNTIVTDVASGNVAISGTEAVVITTDGGFDVDTTGTFSIDADGDSNISLDSGNLIISITSSGDIINRLDSPGVDFVIDQGAGSEFLRAETSVNELRLGDLSPEKIDVRVLSDLVVDGDFTVQGTTTFVNTEDLFVEDRLLRLNVGTEPSFNGTTGIELEVGSDGYAEFHWDQGQGRWELSIDTNVTPEAQTFRPIPYLADSPPTLDLSDTGNDGFPTAGPNLTGAASINTNATNFPYSFGDYMADNSVQAALEAIDAYFIDISDDINNIGNVDLQTAYENGNTIVTSAADGDVTISGTESLLVDATGGIDLDSDFDQDGATFNVDLTGAASIDAGAASNFTTTAGAVTIDGAGGIVLDGNGSNVTPAVDNTDSLGAPGLGWTDVYLRNVPNNATVGLRDAGTLSDLPNTTSGAAAVGTASENFETFGPDMTDQHVQAALEAIDGYFIELSQIIQDNSSVTLQQAYENGNTITTNAADGDIVIDGTEALNITSAGGINLDSGFDMDATGDSFDVELTDAGFSLDAYNTASNITVDSGDLVVGTTTSGVLTLEGATGVVIDGNGEGVRPASDCTDDLGRADAGWRELYICNVADTTVALGAAGSDSTANTTSGATAVGTNSNNFSTFGPDMTDNSVQAALEAIDGYFANLSLDDLTDTFYTKEVGLPTNGAILNGNVRVSQDGIMPSLDFRKNQTGRACWTVPVPTDWDGISDITVEIVWSAENSSAGDVAWRLEYLSLTTGELASGAATTVDYTQATSGTADEVQTTGSNLVIPASAIDQVNDEVLAICVARRGKAGPDTYNQEAQVHLVKYSYTAENIVD